MEEADPHSGVRSPGPTALLCSLHLVNQTTKGQHSSFCALCPVCKLFLPAGMPFFSSCLTPACSFAIWLRHHLLQEAFLPYPLSKPPGALLPLATLPSAS